MRGRLTGVTLALLAAGCGTTDAARPPVDAEARAAAAPGPVPEIRAGLLAGYLAKGAAPNSLAILPPAPAQGSPTQARDDAAAAEAARLRGGPRWTLAARDADLKFPAPAEAFSCALDVRISEATTPRTYLLMRRTLTDVGLSTYPTKTRFQRARPFMVAGGAICTPEEEAVLRKDGSYPSGHSAVGWGWALILTQAAPERADALLARGRAYGQSRVVCNVHWLSDTEEGRVIAAATVARLQSDPQFRADLEAARAEIAAARAAGARPAGDCAAEAAALAAG